MFSECRRDLYVFTLAFVSPGIDPSTHVLEFRATGVGMSVERHFPVVNPTDVDQRFKWICRDDVVDHQSREPPFRCCVPSGSIISGQQCTVGDASTSGWRPVSRITSFTRPSTRLSVGLSVPRRLLREKYRT